MPNWKKVITSGSDATVKTLLISDTADGDALIGNSNILHEGSNTTATNLTVGTATNSTNATNEQIKEHNFFGIRTSERTKAAYVRMFDLNVDVSEVRQILINGNCLCSNVQN